MSRSALMLVSVFSLGVAGCAATTPTASDMSAPASALSAVFPARGGVALAAFVDPETRSDYLTPELVRLAEKAETCHQEETGAALDLDIILPALTQANGPNRFETLIENSRAAQIAIIAGRSDARRMEATMVARGGEWRIADLSGDGKLLSTQWGTHCAFLEAQRLARTRAANATEAEAEAAATAANDAAALGETR